MPSADYEFVTHWRVEATPAEVFAIIDDPPALPRWWPSVYLEVIEREPGDPNGVGRTVDLLTKGWLPYTLRWRLVTLEKVPPMRIVLEAQGDFVGRGVWTFAAGETAAPTGGTRPVTDVTYDWRIRAEKPLLRSLSWLMKPVFSANHRWAMDRGEESLKLELLRRRATSEAEQIRIPAPPPPTTTSSLPLLLGGAAVAALVGGIAYGLAKALGR
jgi:uncharacterized protein YndB with AHSA1/START domain